MDIKSPVAEARNEYTYNVGGQKLKVVQKWNPNYSTTPVISSTINTASLTQTKTTDYVGNKVYENGVIRRILVDGGYIEDNTYHFYQTDHLGNNRVVAKADGTLVQKTHYYPFGSSFAVATGAEKQPYKYNGKEFDQMHGLNLYDYSARYYESAIGRFTTVDPLAEKYYSWSPYNYGYNNPIRYIDPTGEGPGDVIKGFFHGLVGHDPNDKSQSGYLLDTGQWKDYDNDGVETGNADYDVAWVVGSVVMDIIEVVASPGGKGTVPVKMGAKAAKYGPKAAKTIQKVGEKLEKKQEKPTRNERIAAKKDKNKNQRGKKKESSSESTYNQETEHTANSRNSTEEKHQRGQSRKKQDKGGEKADIRRKRYK